MKHFEILVNVLLWLLILSAGPAFIWYSTTQRMETFNRLTTGPKITFSDAFWLDVVVPVK
jgi:TRAP-type C4-dicarboxylate transport system permease small subunit